MDVYKIREDFPFLKRMVKGKPIIYFDNSASNQKPAVVIDALRDFYANHNANIHRGVHILSQEASELYEKAHDKAAKFIGAHGREEIIFTRNATESINLVSHTLDFKAGDEIIISEMEHHSNIVPWLMLKEKGIKLKYIPVSEKGELVISELEKMITKNTKLISVVHMSNFLGTVNPVEEIGKIAHKHNILFMVDGAQSAPHMPINVKKIGCDFFAFSGHKMCGPTGIGVLYGRKDLLKEMKPFLGGGDMISTVAYDSFKPNELPWKFEAGTPNVADGYAFGVAVDYLSKIGMQNVWKHECELGRYAYEKMAELGKITIYGPEPEKRGGVISFSIKGLEPHDIAGLLNERANIAVRSGFHCVEPLHRKYGLPKGSCRASFYVYNTKEEIDKFIDELKILVKTF
ncbi:MAG: cysteine desulfurase [Candidatus Nanoarchaeia archaeon]|nr:cysteine desulfurase [Candidatus Nanoarchaeia archaeon]MDD5239238.1 cysteine desulfurase [Candidatus Nanoarchaeia archaeon]